MARRGARWRLCAGVVLVCASCQQNSAASSSGEMTTAGVTSTSPARSVSTPLETTVASDGEPSTATASDDVLPTSSGAQASPGSGAWNLERMAALPESDDRLVWSAVQQATKDCMAEAGISYSAEPYPAGGDVADELSNDYPAQSAISEYGFDWRASLPQPPTVSAPPADQSDAYWAALNGVEDDGSDGCGQRVSQQLSKKDFENVQQLYYDGMQEVAGLVALDEKMVGAGQLLRQCATDAGFTFVDEPSAYAEAIAVGDGDLRSSEAISVAIVYYSCAEKAQFLEIYKSLTKTYSERWLAESPGTIQAWNEARQAYVEACKAFLS